MIQIHYNKFLILNHLSIFLIMTCFNCVKTFMFNRNLERLMFFVSRDEVDYNLNLVIGSVVPKNVTISSSTLLKIVQSNCWLIEDSNDIQAELSHSQDYTSVFVDSKFFRKLKKSCKKYFSSSSVKIDFTFLRQFTIYPGTKWCGQGNIASHEQDLGEEKETDICCREHDYCPDNIYSQRSKYHLINRSLYTK